MQDSEALADQEIPRPRRAVVVATVLTVAALALVVGLMAWSMPRSAGNPGVMRAQPGEPAIATIWRVLFLLGIVALLAHVLRAAAVRLGQPGVIGEIVAGLAFGPSLLGWAAPTVGEALLPHAVVQNLTLAGTASLTLYMFSVGWDFDLEHVRAHATVLVPASLAMVSVPLAFGALAAFPFLGRLTTTSVPPFAALLFVGTALSVTAFPVLVRIVAESGLADSRVGRTAMLSAAGSDVLAWGSLALSLAFATSSSPSGAALSLGATVALVIFSVGILRPVLTRVGKCFPNVHPRLSVTLSAIIGLVFSLAAITELIGVHAVFGAFLAGLVLPKDPIHIGTAPERLDHLNRTLLLPAYFVVVGLQVDLREIGRDLTLTLAGLVVLTVAVLTKLGAAGAVGMAMGYTRREAAGLGVLMNARGITEIVVLGAGLNSGIITGAGFTVLVVMALVTTVITAPLLKLLRLGRWETRPVREETVPPVARTRPLT